MNKLPQPAWACFLAFLGVIVAVVVLFTHSSDNIRLAVLQVGSSLVTGALGAFAGHATSQSNQNFTGDKPVVNQTPVLPQTGTTDS